MAASSAHRRIAGWLALAGVTLIAVWGIVTWRMRVRNREIARTLLRIERHVATGIPLPTSDPLMIDLLQGLSRWNVGSPHFQVDRGFVEVYYFNRIGPIEWTRSDQLKQQSDSSPLWVLHQTYALAKPRFSWLGAQTIATPMFTLTNTAPEPAP
jgi:hypothetical protein